MWMWKGEATLRGEACFYGVFVVGFGGVGEGVAEAGGCCLRRHLQLVMCRCFRWQICEARCVSCSLRYRWKGHVFATRRLPRKCSTRGER